MKAYKELELSAESGNIEAQETLMDRFYFGLEGRKNLSLALKWARRAASKSPHAQSCLADAYEKGKGVPKDLKQAFLWYKKAAKSGDTHAQVCLALAYELGLGIKKSVRSAMFWYTRAAAQNSSDAAYNLGQYYSERGPQNFPKAVEWWRKAAMNGHKKAQCNLGVAYEKGNGVERSVIEAAYWYKKAAKAGDKLAKNNLARFEKPVKKLNQPAKVDLLPRRA